jgi:magnesium transporter
MPLQLTVGPRGIGDIEFPSMSRAMALGISFAVAGNVLISFALNLQKLAHARLEAARAERGHGLDVIEQEGTASTDGEASEIEVQREPLPPELEREARVWNRSPSQNTRSETDPLMALLVTPNADQVLAVPTYGALFPNANESHIRTVESSPLRPQPKAAKRPGTGTGVDAEYANRSPHQGLNNNGPQESEYLKSKLWYALPISLRPARV